MIRKMFPILILLLAAQGGAFGQDVKTYEASSSHYQVVSEISAAHAAELGRYLDSLYDYFASLFHFEAQRAATGLRVRILANKERYDGHLKSLIDQTREDFIYLHYGNPGKRELVGYATDEENFRVSLNHQAFVQIFRSFVSNPPLWIREGFAVYFEKISVDPGSHRAVYSENLAWLDTLKDLAAGQGDRLLPLETVLSLTNEGARDNIEVFYPQAWGLVSFLMNSPKKEHNRLLWDAVAALQPEASLEDNIRRVYDRSFKWYDQDSLCEDFFVYLEGRRSFRSLLREGMDAYTAGRLDEAERALTAAGEMEKDNFMPPYYRGLIEYARKNYSSAEELYKIALEKGAQPSLIYYALGINAYADRKPEEAVSYLKIAAEIDPEYREKAEELMGRMGGR